MNHEITFLNSKRQFLLLDNDTWYDANTAYTYYEEDPFLIGKVKQVMNYEEYTSAFPEASKIELKSAVSDFSSGVFIRCIKSGVVTYNYDSRKTMLNLNSSEDLRD
jgi:hypothetical protein